MINAIALSSISAAIAAYAIAILLDVPAPARKGRYQ